MSEQQPYIDPPDPFSAMGPDGGHYQPGAPTDMPLPNSGPAPAPPPQPPPATPPAPAPPPLSRR